LAAGHEFGPVAPAGINCVSPEDAPPLVET
jgi:hypothetical protein